MSNEVLSRSEQRPPAPPRRECRIHERLIVDVPAACQPTSAWGRKDSRWSATIRDISLSGICLIVSRRFEAGVGLGIELPATEGQDAYVVLARVIHVKNCGDGSWMLGCKFISELSDDEVNRLLPAVPKEETPEPEPIAPSQLASASNTLYDVHICVESGRNTISRYLIKRLAIPATWPPIPGKILTMQRGSANEPSLRLAVIDAAQDGGRWTLRCRLLNPI